MRARSHSILLVCAAFAVGGVALAVFLQHVFDMAPCPWCTFQRLIFLAVAAAALLAAALRGSRPAFAAAGALTTLLAAGGIWAALHHQLVAAKATSCAFTFADRVVSGSGLDRMLPWLFEATASCAEASVSLLGIPFAVWSATLFAVLFLLSIGALRAGLREPR